MTTLSLRFTAACVMELLKLRRAVDLLNEFWQSRRLTALPSLLAGPCLSSGWVPKRTGCLDRMQGLELLRDNFLFFTMSSSSETDLDDKSACNSISTNSLAAADWLDTVLSALKYSFWLLGSAFTLSSMGFFSLLVSTSPREGGWVYRCRGNSVSAIWAELASWLLRDTCRELSSNWTLQFSLSLLSQVKLLLSVCCLFKAELHFDWLCNFWFGSGPSLCLAVISCGLCWFTVKAVVPWFEAGDGFRRSAEVGLWGLLPYLLLHPFLDLEGITRGKDFSLCWERSS